MITNYIKIAILGMVTLGLVACSGKEEKVEAPTQQPVAIVADCVFPNTEQAAPTWVCDEPVEGLELQAVGIAEKSDAGISYMKDLAAADARGRIASEFRVRVDKMVKSYIGTTGVGDTETVDRAAESVLKTISSETLQGTKVYKSRTGPNGRLYVLVGVNQANLEKSAKQAAKTSMNNDNALWQQFKAKQGFDEMAEEISKQKVQ